MSSRNIETYEERGSSGSEDTSGNTRVSENESEGNEALDSDLEDDNTKVDNTEAAPSIV